MKVVLVAAAAVCQVLFVALWRLAPLWVFLVALFTLALAEQPRSASPLVGTYTCQGQQQAGTYTLHLVVSVHHEPETWLFKWSERQDSGIVMSGLAIRQLDQVAVALVSADGTIGIASYVVTAGKLNGLWSMGGSVWPEHCAMGEPA